MERQMKNQLTDLNDYLFTQLERLSSKDLSPEEMEREMGRSSAICGVSTQIINNAALALKAHTTINTGMQKHVPKMLGVTTSDE